MYLVVANSPVSRRVRSPSWLDLRLVAGIALVLASILVGVKVVSSADHTVRVWAADHQLAPGVVLQAGDVRSVSVRLPHATSGTGYIAVATNLVGLAVNRVIGAGELIPRTAVGVAEAATTVTIPLGGDNAPKISAGQRLIVWVSTKLCPAAIVLSDVAVQSVQTAHGGTFDASGGADVTVRVSPDLARRVIEALALDGGVLRAGVIDAATPSASVLPDLSSCTAAGS
jgi:hypothetical protein